MLDTVQLQLALCPPMLLCDGSTVPLNTNQSAEWRGQ